MRLFFAFLFWTSAFATQAQDDLVAIIAPYEVSGRWTGMLYQEIGNRLAGEYYFELELKYKDQQIIGSSYILDKKTQSYAHINLTGKLEGKKVRLQESKVTKHAIIALAAWCIKKMDLELEYSEGKFQLNGKWSGEAENGTCTPGSLRVSKAAVRA